MIDCPVCKHKNPQDSIFCEDCGNSIKQPVQFIVNDPIVLDKRRPILFSGVLFINYFGIVFLVLLSINMIFVSKELYKSNFVFMSKEGVLIYYYLIQVFLNLRDIFSYNLRYIISVLGFTISILWLKLIRSLREYDDKSRRIFIGVILFSMFLSFIQLNIPSFLFTGLIFYVLRFHKRTYNLFQWYSEKRAVPIQSLS